MNRQQRMLTGTWAFQGDPCNDGEALGFHGMQCKDARWPKVRVPCTLDSCLPQHHWYEGAGWFRRSFQAPAAWRGRRVAVRFEGVNYHAKVWVNGTEVGEHRDGFLRFEFRIDGLLRWGRKNVIAVRADNERLPDEVPGMQRGWRPYGGILREVMLIVTDLVHVGDVRITAGADGRFRLEADVYNDAKEAADVELAVEIVDAKGRVIARQKASRTKVVGEENSQATVETRVEGIKPWSPKTPALYTARLRLGRELAVERLRKGQDVVDRADVRFGFRTIEVRPDGLLLNGEPIFLTGFNRHEDSPRSGPCPDMQTVRRDILAMKAAGSNFVRLCHYPHHPGELDLCDELGLLVMDEIPLYWWKVSWREAHQDKDSHDEAKMAAARRQLEKMIRRDWNHPSILFWSVSNECDESKQPVHEGNAELIRLAKSLDASRPAVHVSCFWDKHPHFEADDVLCVNGYPNWGDCHNNRRGHSDADLAAGGEIWRERLARVRELYPNKPILVTEWGYPSLEGAIGSAMGEDTQARSIVAEAAGMDAPYVCGLTLWCWADHPWPEEWFINYMTTSPYGVLTRDRRKQPAFDAVRKLFRRKQAQRRNT